MSEDAHERATKRSTEDETPAAAQISVRLDPGEPITGTLTSNAVSTRFCGWMELIAAITAARGQPRQPDASEPGTPGGR